jgi:hypothetical protein
MKNNGSQADVNISVLTKITLKMNFKPFYELLCSAIPTNSGRKLWITINKT